MADENENTGNGTPNEILAPLTIMAGGAGGVTVRMHGDAGAPPVSLEYSTDGGLNWQTFVVDETAVSLGPDQAVQFRSGSSGNACISSGPESHNSFVINGGCSVSGSVDSLLTQDSSAWSSGVQLGEYCYYGLFAECISITSAPVLPSGQLAKHCYERMFAGCADLVSAPSIADGDYSLYEACYKEMFQGCTGLTASPLLPNTTADVSCYEGMFEGCTGITTAGAIRAAAAAPSCFKNMFKDCTSLVSAPVMDTTTAVEDSHYGMFRGCSSLGHVDVNFDDANGATAHWLDGVGEFGLLEMPNGCILPHASVDGLPPGWTFKAHETGGVPVPDPNCLTLEFPSGAGAGQFVLKQVFPSNAVLMFSESESTGWLGFRLDSDVGFEMEPGSTISFSARTYDSGLGENPGALQFLIRLGAGVSGSVNSLLQPNHQSVNSIPPGCFNRLFYQCGIYSAPDLPAQTVGPGAYAEMFAGAALETPPVIGAVNLSDGCFVHMFGDCTSLISAPELPATTLAYNCYEAMFAGCSSLASGPTVLPAEHTAPECYSRMFAGCLTLAAPPVIAATDIAYRACYEMFSSCTGMEIPEGYAIPAESIGESGCEGMFASCSSMTRAPLLSTAVLTRDCFRQMFEGCTSLTNITVGFLNWNDSENSTDDWVLGVPSTGTFACRRGLPKIYDESHIPGPAPTH